MRRVSLRLLPLLFTLFVCNYLDRNNVAMAKLQMSSDLGFSESVYGFGASIFFVGYAILEVPSNIILARWGARRLTGQSECPVGASTVGRKHCLQALEQQPGKQQDSRRLA